MFDHLKELHEKYDFNVLPLKKFKRLENGSKELDFGFAYTQYHDVKYDFSNFDETKPPNAIFIITGKTSNLTIVDIDSREVAKELETALNTPLEDLCDYIVKTQKGYQLFFKYQPNLESRIRQLKGVDILNDRRLTFADPYNESYSYIKRGELVSIPQNLLDYLLGSNVKPLEGLNFNERQVKNFYKSPLCILLKRWLALKQGDEVPTLMREEIQHRLLSGVSYFEASREGMRHNLSIKLAGICAADPTIDEDLFFKFCERFISEVIKPDEDASIILDYAFRRSFEYDTLWEEKFADSNKDINERLGMEGWSMLFDVAEDKYLLYNIHTDEKLYFNSRTAKIAVAQILNCKAKEVDLEGFKLLRDKQFNPQVSETFTIREDSLGGCVLNAFREPYYMGLFKSLEPKGEMPSFIGRVIKNVIPDEEQRALFLHNLAFHLTYKVPCQTAIILMGESQGTGKGVLFDHILKEVYKPYHLKWSSLALGSNFNGELKNKLFIHCNEMYEPSGKYNHKAFVNALKNLVAEGELTINAKGKQVENVKNFAFVVASTNERHPFDLDEGDNRRFNFFPTSQTPLLEVCPELTDAEFDMIKKIKEELPDFLSYLKTIKLDRGLYCKVIKTKEYFRILEESRPEGVKVADAILNRDIPTLEDKMSPEFLDKYEKLVVENNLAYIKVKDLKELLGRDYTYYVKSLKSKGVVFEYRYLKSERSRSRVCIWNPQGVWAFSLLNNKPVTNPGESPPG